MPSAPCVRECLCEASESRALLVKQVSIAHLSLSAALSAKQALVEQVSYHPPLLPKHASCVRLEICAVENNVYN